MKNTNVEARLPELKIWLHHLLVKGGTAITIYLGKSLFVFFCCKIQIFPELLWKFNNLIFVKKQKNKNQTKTKKQL